ncbi:ribose transport system substrate-binding protein [Paenibacillaceae bacterium GAS479]|nr:ribose transport system substrate-binding protein [Paenibacillaceae bacterium GAS479]
MNSRGWLWAIAALLLLFAGLMGAFLKTGRNIGALLTAEESAVQAKKRIVLIGQEQGNPYWESILQGAEKEAVSRGIQLRYMAPARINPEEQIRLLDYAISTAPHAILVQGFNRPKQARLIEKAAEQGIAVLAVDADEPGSRRLAYVGTDNLAAGRALGEQIAKAIGATSGESAGPAGQAGSAEPDATAEVGVLVANAFSYSQQLRLEGLKQSLARYPGLRITEVRESGNSVLKAAQQGRELLRSGGNVRVLAGLSALDGPGLAIAAEEETGKQVQVYAFDLLKETELALEQCRITATMVQEPEMMGREAVRLAAQYGQAKVPRQLAFTPIRVRTSAEARGRRSCP